MKDLRFPIGEYHAPIEYSDQLINQWIDDIASFPASVEALVKGLDAVALNWRYRPDGWTIKQVIHHCADSHTNSIIRFKLALTEDRPTIRPYYEDRWAELADGKMDDISVSLQLLHALHQKWVILLRGITSEELLRTFFHPEADQTFTLRETIGSYAWHCNHHLAHVQQALDVKGNFN
jgi:hypothetical protein